MKKSELAKRASALSVAAALTVSALCWDNVFLNNKDITAVSYAEDAAAVPNNRKSAMVTSKSEYPSCLVITSREPEIVGEFVIGVEYYDIVRNFFDINIIIPADPSDPESVEERKVINADGVTVPAGAYTVEITAKEDTLAENPYDLNGFTDNKLSVTINTWDLNASQFVYPENGTSFFYLNDNTILSPLAYDYIKHRGYTDTGNILISNDDEYSEFESDMFEPDMTVLKVTELRTGDVPESSSYTIKRYTKDNSVPYYYGEKVRITPYASKVRVGGDPNVYTKPFFYTVGNGAVTAEPFTVTLKNDSGEFVVEEQPDKFIVKPANADVVAGKIYQIAVEFDTGTVVTNEPLVIDKNNMTGDIKCITKIESTDFTVNNNTSFGRAVLSEDHKLLTVTPNSGYSLGKVYIIPDSDKKRVELLPQNNPDGSVSYNIDTTNIHCNATIEINYFLALSIDLAELARSGQVLPLADGIGKVEIVGQHHTSGFLYEDRKENSFDVSHGITGAQLLVTVTDNGADDISNPAHKWMIHSVNYNGGSNGVRVREDDPTRKLVDIMFDLKSPSHNVQVQFELQAFAQSITAGEGGTAELQGIDADGNANYSGSITVNAVPKAGYYVKSITRNGTEIFSAAETNGAVISNNGMVSLTDPEKVKTENNYEVVFAEAEENSNTASLNITKINDRLAPAMDTSLLWNGSGKSYNVSTLVDEYDIEVTGEDAEYNYYEASAESEDYNFIQAAKVVCHEKIQQTGEEMHTVYFLDKTTGVVTKTSVAVNAVAPDIQITDFDVTTDKSTLRFLSFGIFGHDTMTVKVTAEDKSLVPLTIDAISAVSSNGNVYAEKAPEDASASVEFTFDPDKDPHREFTVQASSMGVTGVSYTVNVENGDIKNVTPSNEETGYINLYLETGAPDVNISPVIRSGGNDNAFEPVLENSKKSDKNHNGFYHNDGLKFHAYSSPKNSVWTNAPFEYKVEASDKYSGIESVSVNGKVVSRSSDPKLFESAESADCRYTGYYKADMADGSNSITVTAEDLAMNKSFPVSKTIRIDRSAPELKIESAVVVDGNGNRSGYTSGSWTNKRVVLTLSAEDKESGVYSINSLGKEKLEFAGEEVDSATGISRKKRYTLTIPAGNNGTYIFDAVDNVSNKSKQVSFTVRTEDFAPSVNSFYFDKNKSGYSIDDEDDNSYPAQEMDYGYYFFDDTVVRINAADDGGNISSGINRYEYSLIDASLIPDGTDINDSLIAEAGIHTISGKSEPVFRVPANWAGQIVARVFDNAGNCSGWRTPDGIILESQAQHNAEEHISIQLPETAYKTTGTGVKLYDKAVRIPMVIKDNTGIGAVDWALNTSDGQALSAGHIGISSIDHIDDDRYEVGSVIKDSAGINWTITEMDKNNITRLEAVVSVNQERSNMELSVSMKCNSGHSSASSASFSIDTQAPVIQSVTFDNNAANEVNGKKYYNTHRTATVRVKERNLDTKKLNELINVAVSNPSGPVTAESSYTVGQWRLVSGESDIDSDNANIWEAKVTFIADADYTFSMAAADAAGHKSGASNTEAFTIDTIAPVLTASFDNNDAKNEVYYHAARKATVKVVDHNFDPKAVKFDLSAFDSDNTSYVSLPSLNIEPDSWKRSSSDPDEWTASVVFSRDGKYSFRLNYTDPARNSASPYSSGTFYIDTTAPKIMQTFTGELSDKRAVNGTFAPTVTFLDFNMADEGMADKLCKVVIEKVDVNGKTDKKFTCSSQKFRSGTFSTAASYELIYDIFGDDPETDGIYNITITAEDMAGNAARPQHLTVSVNRYGSTYEVINEPAIDAIKKFSEGTPVSTELQVVVREISPSEITEDREVTVIRNGYDTKKIDSAGMNIESYKTGNKEVNAAESEEEPDGWYEYIYTLNSDNFNADGNYLINIQSKDEAGNINSNNAPVYAERKCGIEFTIDRTAPEVIIAGVEDNAVLKESETQLRITCSDQNMKDVESLSKNDIVVKINNHKYDVEGLRMFGASLSSDSANNIIIELPIKATGRNSTEDILVSVKDKAGNYSEDSKSGIKFKLSASFFQRNMTASLGIGASGLLALIAVAMLLMKKRKK